MQTTHWYVAEKDHVFPQIIALVLLITMGPYANIQTVFQKVQMILLYVAGQLKVFVLLQIIVFVIYNSMGLNVKDQFALGLTQMILWFVEVMEIVHHQIFVLVALNIQEFNAIYRYVIQ